MNKVILFGNPNTGKTTLFNQLTGAKEKASNWHGVTVEVKEKACEINGEAFSLCDLPGVYSLNGISDEEVLASKYIKDNLNELVVCVVDANNLKRNMLLAVELMELCDNLIIAVNMANEVKNINVEALSEKFGVQFVLVDARKKKGVLCLKNAICNKSNEKGSNKRGFKQKYLNNINTRLDRFEDVVAKRFDYIDRLLSESGYNKIDDYGQSKIDKVLLNPILAPIIFIVVIGLVFFVTFGFIGEYISGLFFNLFEGVGKGIFSLFLDGVKNERLILFIKDGVGSGVSAVLSFLPQILIMSFCLNLLEDFGYLSRVSIMFDGYLKKIGLTGRSVFSLIMGFGCTTSAVLTTRNLGVKADRENTVLCLPFMSCSAKLPIYSIICSVFFKENKFIFVFLLYVFAFLLMILFSYILNKTKKVQNSKYFMQELPKFRVPTLKKVFLDSFVVVKNFISKVGFSILISSLIIYLLYNFNFKFQFVDDKNDSIIHFVANNFSFILAPIGLNMAGIMVALISGLIAKEMVVSSLVIVNGCSVSTLAESLVNVNSPVHFSLLTAVVFLVFVLLYTPCVSSLICVKKELGKKVMFKSLLVQTSIAYFTALVVYFSGILIVNGFWWCCVLLLIFIAITIFSVLKLISNKTSVGNKMCLLCEGGVCGNCKL